MTEASITVFDENLTPVAVLPWSIVPGQVRAKRTPEQPFAISYNGARAICWWHVIRPAKGSLTHLLMTRDFENIAKLPQALIPAQADHLRRRIERESLTQVWASLVGP